METAPSPVERRSSPASPAPESTALERLYAAARALRESIDGDLRASQQRLKDAADAGISRYAPTAGSLLQRAPTPGRIRDLAEAPEKAAIAGASAAVSAIVPAAAPIVGTAARVVEKQVDRARDPDSDGRTR